MFVPGCPFQISLIFVGKARRPDPERGITQVGPELTCKARWLARDKHLSLFVLVISDEKSFITLIPGVNVINMFKAVTSEVS